MNLKFNLLTKFRWFRSLALLAFIMAIINCILANHWDYRKISVNELGYSMVALGEFKLDEEGYIFIISKELHNGEQKLYRWQIGAISSRDEDINSKKIETLRTLPNIQYLSFLNCNFSEDVFVEIFNIRTIQSLKFTDCSIPSDGYKRIHKSKMLRFAIFERSAFDDHAKLIEHLKKSNVTLTLWNKSTPRT